MSTSDERLLEHAQYVQGLEAENARLRAASEDWQAAVERIEAEVKRLRGALGRLRTARIMVS